MSNQPARKSLLFISALTVGFRGLLAVSILHNWLNMTPFDTFIYDHYRESEGERKEALQFLLSEVVYNVSLRTAFVN